MWSQLLERWNAAEPGKRRTSVLLVTALALTVGGSSLALRSHGAMSVLFSGLPPSECRDIAAELARQGIDYKISDDEGSISVPSRLEARARMRLAGAGLPRSSPEKGWEIFGEGGLAVTKPQQQAMQIRALQGELARSIASLDNVSKAAVHISLKQESPFLEQQEPAKAAVLLHVKPGVSISRDEAMAIAHLVAKSVPDLETAQVTLLDEKGGLLFSDNVARGAGSGDGAQKLEKDIERRVQSQLDMTFGLGKAIVRATASMDTERGEIRRTTYTPMEGQREGVAGRETVEAEQYAGSGSPTAAVGGVPGTGGNLFNERPGPAGGAEGNGNYVRNRSEREFKVNEQQEVVIRPGGELRRVTLGIFVDESLKDSLTQIETVARNAAGIDEQRGDSISVESVKFTGSDVTGFTQTTRSEMVRTVARLILNALALIIGLLTLRSILSALKPVPGGAEGMYAGQPQLTGLSGQTPLLTSSGGFSGGGMNVPGAHSHLLDAPDDDGLDPDFEPVMSGPTPEELVERVDESQLDDVAEVLRHWLEGDLNE